MTFFRPVQERLGSYFLMVAVGTTAIWIGVLVVEANLVVYVPLTLAMLAISIVTWSANPMGDDLFSLRRVLVLSLAVFYVIPAVDLSFILPFTHTALPYRLYHAPISGRDEGIILAAYAVALAGILCLWLGWYVLGDRLAVVAGKHWRPNADAERTINYRSLAGFGLVYLVIGSAALGYGIQKVGGWTVWSSSHWAERSLEQANSIDLLVGQLWGLLMVGTYILIVVALKSRSKWYLIVALISIGANVLYWTFAGGRKNIVWLILGFVMAWHYLRGSLSAKRALPWLVLMIVLMMFLAPLRSVLPTSTLMQAPGLALYNMSATPLAQLARGTLDFVICHDTFLTIIEKVGNAVPPSFGSTYMKLFLIPIPRSIWPSKPISAGGVAVQQLYGADAFGISQGVTVMGEAYLNFLFPGVLAIMLILGVVFRLCWAWIQPRLGTVQGALVYMALVPYIVELFRSDSFVTFEFLIQIAAVLVAVRYSRKVASLRTFAALSVENQRSGRVAEL